MYAGFNEHSAFTLADAKKKGDGNSELRNEIDYGLDVFTDYTLLVSILNKIATHSTLIQFYL